MEKVLKTFMNASVIRAAASSPRGVLSLMCLIVGILALALFQSSPDWAKLIVFLVILLGVGGFGQSIVRQSSSTPLPQVQVPAASREFFLGKWQVEQAHSEMEGATFMEYFEDGTFSGKVHQFTKDGGSRFPISGSWKFIRINNDQFRVALSPGDGPEITARFRVLDLNRIHNVEQNYVAVRIPI